MRRCLQLYISTLQISDWKPSMNFIPRPLRYAEAQNSRAIYTNTYRGLGVKRLLLKPYFENPDLGAILTPL